MFLSMRMPNIHQLAISERAGHMTHILGWFTFRGVTVNSLSVSLGNLDFGNANHYLRALGSSLLFLEIDAAYGIAEMVFLQLNLSFSTQLQTLRFRNFSLGSRRTVSFTIPAMFSRATSPYIHRIEFAYTLPEVYYVFLELQNDARTTTPESSMWSTFDAALSRFRGLRTVLFRLSPLQPEALPLVSYVRRGLPSCNARGLLSFEHAFDEQHMFPLFSRTPLWNGMVRGPLCVAQMQDSMIA